MTTRWEEQRRREAEWLEAEQRRYDRERRNLTVRKVVVTRAVCDRCHASRPYSEGDEDRICPSCGGGVMHSWTYGTVMGNDSRP